MHLSRMLRLGLVVVLAALIGLGGTTAALAAPVDDSGYTEEQRAEAAKTAANKAADDLCELIVKSPALALAEKLPLPGKGPKGLCKDVVTPVFENADDIEALTADALCASMPVKRVPLTDVTVDFKYVCSVVVADSLGTVRQAYWDAYGAALSAFDAVESAVVEAVAFVTDPVGSTFDRFLNALKENVVEGFVALMGALTSATAFQPDAEWWRDAYAATGGIGLVLLALSLMLSGWQYSRGIIGPDEARRAFGWYPLVAVLMMCLGPPVAHVLASVADGMSAGIIDWMGPEAVDALLQGGPLGTLTMDSPGMTWGILIFLCMALALLGLIGTLLVQTISTYMLGAVSAAAWGMSANPKWRSKALAVPATAAALIFARPAALLALAIAAKFAAWLTDDAGVGFWRDGAPSILQQITNSFMVIILLVMVAFAPWTFLKWMPLGMDAADSVRSSGPVGTEAALGAAGSTAVTMSMMRARSHASHSSTVRTVPTGPPRGGPPPGPAPGAAPAAAKTGGAAVSAGGKTAAGAGGKAAAGAAGGAATGGALLAAQLAIAATQAAVRKAREAADAAAPDTSRAQYPGYSG